MSLPRLLAVSCRISFPRGRDADLDDLCDRGNLGERRAAATWATWATAATESAEDLGDLGDRSDGGDRGDHGELRDLGAHDDGGGRRAEKRVGQRMKQRKPGFQLQHARAFIALDHSLACFFTCAIIAHVHAHA